MGRKKVGLALSGGGARGFAHIGVLKVLAENSVPIDMIAGTSAGSFVGAALAAGLSIQRINEIGKQISWFNMTGLSYSPRALLSNAAMGNFIRQHFPIKRIEDFPVPFAAVACDLGTGERIVLKDTGDVAFAVRASCAVPGVFTPLDDEKGRLLIDGGVLDPVPVDVARDMGAEIVIAVDLLSCGATFRSTPRTAVGMLFQSAMLLLRAASRSQHYHADVLIEPQIAHLRHDEIRKRDEFIQLGEAATLQMLPTIRALVG